MRCLNGSVLCSRHRCCKTVWCSLTASVRCFCSALMHCGRTRRLHRVFAGKDLPRPLPHTSRSAIFRMIRVHAHAPKLPSTPHQKPMRHRPPCTALHTDFMAPHRSAISSSIKLLTTSAPRCPLLPMRAGAHHRDRSVIGNRQSRTASTSRLGLVASTALTPLLFQHLPLLPAQASINQQPPNNYRKQLTYCFASNMTPITG